MGRIAKLVTILACVVFVPAVVFAQASITGVVKDASGAVLPGVTVEASSPVLIEKVALGRHDGTGQYRIVDLASRRLLRYVLLCRGFSTVKRDGIELTGSFVATVKRGPARRGARGNDHGQR